MLLFNKPKEASSKKFMPGIDHEVSEGKQGRIVLAKKFSMKSSWCSNPGCLIGILMVVYYGQIYGLKI